MYTKKLEDKYTYIILIYFISMFILRKYSFESISIDLEFMFLLITHIMEFILWGGVFIYAANNVRTGVFPNPETKFPVVVKCVQGRWSLIIPVLFMMFSQFMLMVKAGVMASIVVIFVDIKFGIKVRELF